MPTDALRLVKTSHVQYLFFDPTAGWTLVNHDDVHMAVQVKGLHLLEFSPIAIRVRPSGLTTTDWQKVKDGTYTMINASTGKFVNRRFR